MNAPVLSVEGLTVSYGSGAARTVVLRDMTFRIEPGQALGIVGESGSGKSTAAVAVLGLLDDNGHVDAGRMVFKGQDLTTMTASSQRALRGAAISIVFQDPFTSLNPAMRIGRQIAEPLMLHRGLSQEAARAEALRLFAEVQLADPARVARSFPHELSGGMKQRALIATALACNPELLILDEPTTALDVTVEAQILDLLHELRRARQLAILFISHNLAVVSRVCENICVLYAGQLVEQGPTSQVLRSPKHPYTKGLLAAMPALSPRGTRLPAIPGRLPAPGRLPTGCVFHPRCAFALPRCAIEEQVLLPQSAEQLARCWRAEELADVAWRGQETPAVALNAPVDQAAAGSAAISPGFTAEHQRSEAAPLIEARDVTRVFQTAGFLESLYLDFTAGGFPVKQSSRILRAVDGVSLSIAPGEIVGLVGESGSGKTTLGRCMIDLVSPSSGSIRIRGEDLLGASSSRRRTLLGKAQIVFQNPDSSLNPRKTVREILGRPLVLFGLAEGAALERRVDELLDLVRLGPHYRDRYPHQMSGGEKQRVGIARALATGPDFIVCDEAVSALDVSVQASVLNLLADLRDSLGVALLFISHDLSVISHIADRVCVMYRGVIVEEGPVGKVMHNPSHPYTRKLLAAMPHIEGLEAAAIMPA